MPTFSLKIPTPEQKEELQKLFTELKAKYNYPAFWDVQELLIKTFHEGIESLEPQEAKSIQTTLETIGCPFLKYEIYEFKCFEDMDEKKKPVLLGTDPAFIMTRCEACKEGKAQKILLQYRKKLRDTNIRGLLQMIRTFETFAQKGVPSTIYFCNRIKGKQIMTGKKTITCTKHDARVPIATCQDPRCPHFEEYTITVEQEFPKEALALIEGIAEDYHRIEDLSPGEIKTVEAVQEPESQAKKKKEKKKK